MRKILFILSDLPFPRDKNGITLIDYEILTRLPTDYIIDILILNHGEIAKKDKELFNVVFPRVQSVHHQKTNKLKMYINIISRALFNFSVFTSLKISTSKYIDGFDVVYISSVSIDLDVKKIKPPVFFNAVDSFSKFNYREWQVSGKLYSQVKYYLYKNYERYILNYVDAFNLVSKKDKEFMCAIHKNNINKITNINIGVDSSRFHCKSECGYSQEDKKTFNILFLGNFDYNPNADAARFLCNEIYPSLQSMYMDVKVYIVGKNPPNDLLDSKNIIRTGFVSDVSVYYRMATVFICPLKLGAGMKNKILEAMATGLPIISSDVGVEGIDGLTDGENYLRANTLHEYVDAITRVHNNPLLGDGLGRKAAKLISEKYDWQNIVDRYVTKLQDISDTQ